MITDRQRELEAVRCRTAVRVVRRVLECLAAGRPALDDDVLERHPLAALIHRVTLRQGPDGRAVIQAASELLSARAGRDALRLREGRLIGLQCGLVLPARETRDAALGPAAVEEAELEALIDGRAAAVAAVLPEWWFRLVRVAASYTVVTVNGRPAPPRFSGTYSDAFGAVHGAAPADAETYVEVLTHEAGHLWLNLLADADPGFIGNPYAQQCFVSPWRHDARPIHGIFHGAYVFSVVVPALLALRTEAAHARAAQLTVEVRDALRQALAFGSLSAEALEVAASAEARLKAVEPELGAEALAAALAKYASEKERKVRRLREAHADLQVAGEPG